MLTPYFDSWETSFTFFHFSLIFLNFLLYIFSNFMHPFRCCANTHGAYPPPFVPELWLWKCRLHRLRLVKNLGSVVRNSALHRPSIHVIRFEQFIVENLSSQQQFPSRLISVSLFHSTTPCICPELIIIDIRELENKIVILLIYLTFLKVIFTKSRLWSIKRIFGGQIRCKILCMIHWNEKARIAKETNKP